MHRVLLDMPSSVGWVECSKGVLATKQSSYMQCFDALFRVSAGSALFSIFSDVSFVKTNSVFLYSLHRHVCLSRNGGVKTQKEGDTKQGVTASCKTAASVQGLGDD